MVRRVWRNESQRASTIEGFASIPDPTLVLVTRSGNKITIYSEALLQNYIYMTDFTNLVDENGDVFPSATACETYLISVFQPFVHGGSSAFENEYFDVDSSISLAGQITLTNTPINERVLLNGIELSEGATRDYLVSGSDIVFNDPNCIQVGDLIKVNYQT